MTKKFIAASILLTAGSTAALATPSLSERISQVVSPYNAAQSESAEQSSRAQDLLRLHTLSARQKQSTEIAEFARLTLVDENYARLSPMGRHNYLESNLSKTQRQVLDR